MNDTEQTPVDERRERRAYQREWARANRRPYSLFTEAQKKKLTEQHKRWKLRHPEKVRQEKRRHYERHADECRARTKRYVQTHRVAVYAANQKRRALRAKATINPAQIREWMEAVKARVFARCYYCGAKVSTSNIHFDHMVPLARGGEHSVENLAVACAHCNQSKNAKKVSEWQHGGQQILGL